MANYIAQNVDLSLYPVKSKNVYEISAVLPFQPLTRYLKPREFSWIITYWAALAWIRWRELLTTWDSYPHDLVSGLACSGTISIVGWSLCLHTPRPQYSIIQFKEVDLSKGGIWGSQLREKRSWLHLHHGRKLSNPWCGWQACHDLNKLPNMMQSWRNNSN